MVFPLMLLVTAMVMWLTYGRPRMRFLADFAKLLDAPQFVDDLRNRLSGRSFLTGAYGGRKVVILLQHGRKGRAQMLVVSMEAHVATAMESYEFTGYRADREGELALFALEAKHELVLTLQDGCLKALWQPLNSMFFPGVFDPEKWQGVLEAMHSLVGSLERRGSPTLSPSG
jgi:hypothetical protein